MLIQAFKEFLERDVDQLKKEITSYANEKDLWKISGEIKNSGGNLCLHLCGNLQHFIGSVIGTSGYIRERDKEFSKKNISVPELVNEIDVTVNIVKKVLSQLKDEDLATIFPSPTFGKDNLTISYVLMQVALHLNYHLGQINYHRRMIGAC